MTKIIFDIPDYSDAIEKAVKAATTRIGNRIEEEAKETAPVDSGDYRNNIKFNGRDEVAANKEYSAAIEYGVRPRTIRAKTAKALHFTVNGKEVFAKSVKIPAIPPNPVMRNAAKAVQKEVKQIFLEEFKRV